MRQKLEKLVQEYGNVALATYLSLFFLTWAGFFVAISAGLHPQSGTGKWGTVGAAWVAAKVSMPLRLGITVVLTPLVARAWRKLRPPPPSELPPA